MQNRSNNFDTLEENMTGICQYDISVTVLHPVCSQCWMELLAVQDLL